MTEAEWLAGEDPQLMLAFLRGKASDRKLLLFCRAWCDGYEDYTRTSSLWEAAELYAEGEVTRQAIHLRRPVMRRECAVA